jgi:hypothetical protein
MFTTRYLTASAIAVTGVLGIGCSELEDASDSATTTEAPSTTGAPKPEYEDYVDNGDLSGLLTIEEVVTMADELAPFVDATCTALAETDSAGVDRDIAFTAWSSTFDGAGEDFGFTDREVFDEIASRCDEGVG